MKLHAKRVASDRGGSAQQDHLTEEVEGHPCALEGNSVGMVPTT
jgi:hypothetical protein